MEPDPLLPLLGQIDTRLRRIEALLGCASPATYTPAEAAKLRGRSVRYVYNLIRDGVVKPTGPRPYRLPAIELTKII
jgi:hypothetical protein